jgi:RimJ/RimL family protein N-acetyltransferase
MRIYLRAFESGDCQLIHQWRQDPDVSAQTGGNVYFVSLEQERRWVLERTQDTGQYLYLAICLRETHEMIGYLSVINIDMRNRKAEWGGVTIGAKERWNQGYAKEAALLMLKHVFRELGLHRFYGEWVSTHAASVHMAEQLGFQKEGLLRDCQFRNNEMHSHVVMSILRSEFDAIERALEQRFEWHVSERAQ